MTEGSKVLSEPDFMPIGFLIVFSKSLKPVGLSDERREKLYYTLIFHYVAS
jgi:hypothetical protein